VWPGQPMTAHWSIADPDQPGLPVEQQRKLFLKAYSELNNRIKLFISLPFAKLEIISLQEKLNKIGGIK